jgi:hypothetical protein
VPNMVSSPWPGVHHGVILEAAEDLGFKIIYQRSEVLGVLVLPGPPGNTCARCPMVNFGAVHAPHRAQGLGGSLGHGSSRHGIESGSWTSAFLMPPARARM